MREIKFRAWDKIENKMVYDFGEPIGDGLLLYIITQMENDTLGIIREGDGEPLEMLEYTGLKDKNGCVEVYEGDIIDNQGNVKGNIYENHQGESDLIIQGFGTKAWCATYKEAVDRGCTNSE